MGARKAGSPYVPLQRQGGGLMPSRGPPPMLGAPASGGAAHRPQQPPPQPQKGPKDQPRTFPPNFSSYSAYFSSLPEMSGYKNNRPALRRPFPLTSRARHVE